MTHDERDAAIVSAIVGIAKSLRIGVLAEGVESSRHVEQLRALGCDAGQGNFLHQPVSPDRCRALLLQAARHESIIGTEAPLVRLVPVGADADVDS
jgi:EAL domain-containing protein (putative c-di-GMP-specific phosphodiesterase class I)